MKDASHSPTASPLRARRMGIDTYQAAVIYLRSDCFICRAEGFEAQSQVEVRAGAKVSLATLHIVRNDWLEAGEAGFSEAAWYALALQEGTAVMVRHPPLLDSLKHLRAKVHGNRLDYAAMLSLMADAAHSRLSDVHLAAFVTACSGPRLDRDETIALTRAMIDVGEVIHWPFSPVMDKHCVGGLPGNRTTLLVVPIVTACGVVMPKTSSRSITSPAGTADVMETLAPVNLDLAAMRRVVESEGGCIAWGAAAALSPADDVLIRVERPLDLDSASQLVASVLSKKAAAGSERVLIDMPVGPSAKVRSAAAAHALTASLVEVGRAIGLTVEVMQTDGRQPVGRGIGPALEAADVMAVLERRPQAPADLRERALHLAGRILEMAGKAPQGSGFALAERTLEEGRALAKFLAICEAQGGLRTPGRAPFTHTVCATVPGRVGHMDNRGLARTAKLAGAPGAAAAGMVIHVKLDQLVATGQPLFTVHAQTRGELAYALDYVRTQVPFIAVEPA